MDLEDKYGFDINEKSNQILKHLRDHFKPMGEDTGEAWPLLFFRFSRSVLPAIHEEFGVSYEFIANFLLGTFYKEYSDQTNYAVEQCKYLHNEELLSLQLQLVSSKKQIQSLKNSLAARAKHKGMNAIRDSVIKRWSQHLKRGEYGAKQEFAYVILDELNEAFSDEPDLIPAFETIYKNWLK